ncbi:MAG: asparagine--tRNA ligase [Gemmatimonadota bacterium]|jgi:asparaginyl-tRNA synthetase|nr:asparagine--tRNA ligase [Gemmatimonadota bacterium]MDQ8150310.1 asparagine--tRNA ligase [Gemmatimonadota bacterium]MDQ8151902.1 asparagine--tRNA ligase [Gemmatimonadota bacterium]MDQ8174751.1 asparagine--tRNA ligase [Gemmatimonadota bacterium]MDQ8178920.1 asparagine--tRNA ligase [Gemmatimonadota bacterium]
MSSTEPVIRIADLPDRVGQTVTLRGWVSHLRSSGKIAFVVLRDGTGLLQCVVVKKEVDEASWATFGTLTLETSVTVTGEVRADARQVGGVELGVTTLSVIGASPLDYPIQPKEHGVDFLLDHRHFWLRTPRQVAIMRIRHEIEQGIHDFFYERGFLRVDTPILTAAIGERSGLFSTEYFDEGNAYLAQTGQLYGEAAAAAFGKIYTFGPTFRAEKSKTRRHLTEFWMIEPEVAFNDTHANMQLQEDFVSFLVQRVLERRRVELAELERDVTKLEKIRGPFPRIDYTDAVATLQKKGSAVQWGEDLGAEDEALLVEDYETPIFICNYPKEAKAFYMKENPADPRTVLCDDMLAPEGYGEIIGGSQREDDYDKLLHRIQEEGLPLDAYGWYLDLRKYGTFVHSGFGLGLERTVAWICGTPHIRECIPFPRMMHRLRP